MITKESWLETFKAAVLAAGSRLTNWNIGSRIRSIGEGLGLMLEELSYALDAESAAMFVATARADRLTMRAKELGLARKPASAARGICRFTGDEGVTVPAGFRVATGDATLEEDVQEYETTESGVIGSTDDFIVDLAVQAVATGASGNCAAAAIDTLVESLAGLVSVTNPAPLAGGAAEEADQDLRQRCFLAPYRMAVGGPVRLWEALALDVAGVARAKCISCPEGPGTFSVLVWSRDAEARLVAASAALIEDVQTYLDEYVLAGVILTVEAPDGPLQDVTGYLEVASGHTYEEVAPLVVAAIVAYLDGLALNQTAVRAAIIAAAMSVTHVADFRLAVPEANVVPGEGETIGAGLVQVLPLEWNGQYGY